MSWRVPLFDPDLGEAELEAVRSVIRSKWLTMGERTLEFESRFAHYVSSKHAVALSSGTAALHLALKAFGIGAGDEVLCPSLTFVATANAIRYCGAKPVFVDVRSLDEWNVAAETLAPRITPKTRAIIVLHYGGYACDMPSIKSLAERAGLFLIEDAAHSPGASLQGRFLGTWGHAGCFSFFSNKNMTTGEGGMLTTQLDEVAERVRRLRSHGMTTQTLDRFKGHAYSYDVLELGYNFRLGELNAALGIAQLEALESRNASRCRLVRRYAANLASADSILRPFADPPGSPAFHLMPVLLPRETDRVAVMDRMRTAGVQTSIHYRPVDTFSAYVAAGLGPDPDLPLTHRIGERELTLPLYPSMRDEQVDDVCETLRDAVSALTR